MTVGKTIPTYIITCDSFFKPLHEIPSKEHKLHACIEWDLTPYTCVTNGSRHTLYV